MRPDFLKKVYLSGAFQCRMGRGMERGGKKKGGRERGNERGIMGRKGKAVILLFFVPVKSYTAFSKSGDF